jgi:hypothetical protein
MIIVITPFRIHSITLFFRIHIDGIIVSFHVIDSIIVSFHIHSISVSFFLQYSSMMSSYTIQGIAQGMQVGLVSIVILKKMLRSSK